MEPLASTDQLGHFPGASSITAPLVAAAAGHIRSVAGWHIAPKVTETRKLWSPGGNLLQLPTLLLDVDAPVLVSSGSKTWDASQIEAEDTGLLWGSWPKGRLTVTFTHGHDECPADLLAILAELAVTFSRDRTIKQESILSRSVSYGAAEGVTVDDVLSRYKL